MWLNNMRGAARRKALGECARLAAQARRLLRALRRRVYLIRLQAASGIG
jgi:hypothetical protein